MVGLWLWSKEPKLESERGKMEEKEGRLVGVAEGEGEWISRGQGVGGEGGKVLKSLRMSVILEEKKEAKSSAEIEEGGRGGGLRREE